MSLPLPVPGVFLGVAGKPSFFSPIAQRATIAYSLLLRYPV